LNPIYDEYIDFLKHNGLPNEIDLKEGCYWLDRQIIKAYDINGGVHKILRVYTDDELNVTFKTYKKEVFEIELWDKTIVRNSNRLNIIEKESIDLIKNKLQYYEGCTPIIFSSGGKDSMVTSYLVKKLINAKTLFNNTSLDCADTYKFIKQIDNLEILNPQEGFYQWRERENFIPTRFARGCCSIFKEGETIKHIDKNEKCLIFMGMRNEESSGRSGYGDEWKNDKWGKREWQAILPIRKWTEVDIWLYIIKNNIPINEKYKKGYSRVGCAIACPFYNKSTWVLDNYWYPKMYKRWQDILKKDFIDNYKWTRLNCTIKEYETNWNGGLVRVEPTEEVVNEFAEHKGIGLDVAEKYFNHNCEDCDKKVNKKDVIALNLKLNGRNTNTFYCKKHLMLKYNIDKLKWIEMIEDFKKQGCDLF